MTVDGLIRDYDGDAWRALARISVPSRDCVPGFPPESVVVHVRHLGIGGLERVVLEQCRLFAGMRMKVCLAVSGDVPETHYPFPDGVAVRRIPSGEPRDPGALAEHTVALVDVIREFSAGVFLDSTYYDVVEERSVALWDLIAVRLFTSARSVIHWHTAFSRFLRDARDDTRFAAGIRNVPRVCDGLIALSRADRRFFECIGFRSFYIPNPVDRGLIEAVHGREDHAPTVLWCGRVSPEKHPVEAMLVFAAVHRECPEAKFMVVGGGDPRLLAAMRDVAGSEDCLGAVEFVGEKQDPYPYYRRADVLVNTSEREGYPMTFVEAAAFGLPVVSIGKGYLELLREGEANFVANGVGSAAEWITRFFKDEGFRSRTRSAVSVAWRKLVDFDSVAAYSGMFAELVADRPVDRDDDIGLIVAELLGSVEGGFRRHEKRWTDAFAGRAGLNAVKLLREFNRMFHSDRVDGLGRVVRKLRKVEKC